MPYQGRQRAACFARATTCLDAGMAPGWACDDYFHKQWKIESVNKVTNASGYTASCGRPLPPDAPKTTREAKARSLAANATLVQMPAPLVLPATNWNAIALPLPGQYTSVRR